jgi:hypothetical protein
VDSAGYVISMVVGATVGRMIVSVWAVPSHSSFSLLVSDLQRFAIAGAPDRQTDTTSTGVLLHGRLARDALILRNRTLRGLGFSTSVLNLNFGIFTIVIPLIVLERLHQPVTVVDWFWRHGYAGLISAIVSGRMDSRGRERMMLVLPMIGTGNGPSHCSC